MCEIIVGSAEIIRTQFNEYSQNKHTYGRSTETKK